MKEENFEYYKLVGERLREARKNKKLTQKEVAECLGITRSRVTQHETAQCSTPYKTLVKYANLYEVSADWLIDNPYATKVSPFEEYKNVEFTDSELQSIKNYIEFILNQRKEVK